MSLCSSLINRRQKRLYGAMVCWWVSPKGLTNNRKKKALARLSDCQVYSSTEAKVVMWANPSISPIGWAERRLSPPGIPYFAECPTISLWWWNTATVKRLTGPFQSFLGSNVKKGQGCRFKSTLFLCREMVVKHVFCSEKAWIVWLF